MPAYNEPPDLEDIPKNRDDFLIGAYSEIRRIRQMAENIFWVFIVFTVIAGLLMGYLYYLADA